MKSINKRLLYFLYLMAVAVFCLYFLFPSDAVKNYISHKVNQSIDGVQVSMDHVKPNFPPGLSFSAVLFSQGTKPLFEINRLKIVPDYASLLSLKRVFLFEGESYDGSVKGKATISGPKGKQILKINTQFSGIQLNQIAAIPEAARGMISGLLGGNVNYRKTPQQGEGVVAELLLTGAEIRPPEALAQLKSLHFSRVETSASFTGHQLKIEKCTLKGKQLDGKMSGAIQIATPFEKSVFDLKGTLKPHHLFLSGLGKKMMAIMFPNLNLSGKGLPFRIKGSMAKPSFAFN